MGKFVLAIDQGTTGTTALVLDRTLKVRARVNQDAKAAATMLDLDTPFLAASSSRRLACSGWMNRLRR